MLHTKFRRNRPTGHWKEGFKVFTIYGQGSHLGHVTSSMLMNFYFIVSKALWSYFNGNLSFVTYSGVIVKLPSNKG